MTKEQIQLFRGFLPLNTAFILSNKEVNVLSTDKTMCLYYEPSDVKDFKKQAPIYSVDQFLTLVDTLGVDSKLSVSDSSVKIKNGNRAITYVLSGSNTVKEVPKALETQFDTWDNEMTFTLNKTDLAQINKISSLLGLSELKLSGKNGKLELLLTEQDNNSSNNYDISLDYEGDGCEVSFSTDNISKLINDDYEVQVSSNGFSKFKSQNIDTLRYYISNLAV